MRDVKNKGKGGNSGANVRFAAIEDGSPRNAAIATDQADAISEETKRNAPIAKF